MREVIHDIVKQTVGLVEHLKITGTDDSTVIEAYDDNLLMFIKCKLNEPVPEFKGSFGIKWLGMLDGLCNFANYKTDEARLTVKTRPHDGVQVPEQFEFRDATGMGTDFRLTSTEFIDRQPDLKDLNWQVEFEPNKSKVQEFAQLAGLFNEFEKWFGVTTRNGDLIFEIGNAGSASHRASMVFESGITNTLSGALFWPSAQILYILRLAGKRNARMSFSSNGKAGMLRVAIDSDFATYQYLFPSRR